MSDKQCHVAKFAAFISKNSDLPFLIKKRVMEAALFSSILYGYVSWIGSSAIVAQVVYHNIIKTLLGVVITTSNDLCLMELKYPSLSVRFKASQQRFLGNILKDKHGMADDPFIAIWKICSNACTRGAQYLQKVIEEQNHVSKDTDLRKSVIRQSNLTKYKTYEMNPDLSVHPIYLNKDMNLPEYQRNATTRLHLSSHNLAIETGRWSRIQPDQRLCACGSVQTEEHVMCFGIRILHILLHYPDCDYTNLCHIFQNKDIKNICHIVHKSLCEFC